VNLVRWRRARPRNTPTLDHHPEILLVTDPVTRQTASDLVAKVDRLAASTRVVIDLTAIPDFDTEGAAALVGLQEAYGPDRVTIVGLRQATARLVGVDAADIAPTSNQRDSSGWVIRRLRAISVVQAVDDRATTTDDLEPVLDEALATGAGIVVVDLRSAGLTRAGLEAIAFASSRAALNGQELLVVNVDANSSEKLRVAGLSATTYVAPEPLTEG
jgi:anti-anti-sigma regulatory factor